MDEKLIAWGRAVKARHDSQVPPLWIFTDQDRLPDPRPVLGRLPKGLFGVVLRAGRGFDPAVAVGVALLCRQRRFRLVVAGNPRLAARLGAGRHLAHGARQPSFGLGVRCRRAGFTMGGLITAAAHNPAELVQAQRAGADAVFLSPVFQTASHPGASGLGTSRWAVMARRQKRPVLALGGMTALSARRLPRFCAGAGVIGAARGLVFQAPTG